jgi:hypothetical protein
MRHFISTLWFWNLDGVFKFLKVSDLKIRLSIPVIKISLYGNTEMESGILSNMQWISKFILIGPFFSELWSKITPMGKPLAVSFGDDNFASLEMWIKSVEVMVEVGWKTRKDKGRGQSGSKKWPIGTIIDKRGQGLHYGMKGERTVRLGKEEMGTE